MRSPTNTPGCVSAGLSSGCVREGEGASLQEGQLLYVDVGTRPGYIRFRLKYVCYRCP